MGSVTTMWKFSHNGLNLTTISDLRNFHDGECYHDVKVFPRWFKPYHDFRCKEFPQHLCYASDIHDSVVETRYLIASDIDYKSKQAFSVAKPWCESASPLRR
jgi:hypothetical protein